MQARIIGQRAVHPQPDLLAGIAPLGGEEIHRRHRTHFDADFAIQEAPQRLRHPLGEAGAQLMFGGQRFRRRCFRAGSLVAEPLFLELERGRQGKNGLAVLDGEHAPGAEAFAVAQALDLVDNGRLHVAGAQEIGVQGVSRPLGGHGALGGNQRLPDHLSAKDAEAAQVRTRTAKQIVFQHFQIQLVQQGLQGWRHGVLLG
jgi:hypothetical protein